MDGRRQREDLDHSGFGMPTIHMQLRHGRHGDEKEGRMMHGEKSDFAFRPRAGCESVSGEVTCACSRRGDKTDDILVKTHEGACRAQQRARKELGQDMQLIKT